jgi:hypothetical protein
MLIDRIILSMEFWNDSAYALDRYVGGPIHDELVLSIEQELGYRLPTAFIEMMRLHNGGIPHSKYFPVPDGESASSPYIAISGIMGIGREKMYSLCGDLGSRFMIEEWGYPDTGICFCTCPSAGHDMVMLDYSKCGRQGEPEVVHVDQELGYQKTFLAKDFETFVRGLVREAPVY